MMRIARWEIVVSLACSLILGVLLGSVGHASTRWARFTSRDTSAVVTIKTVCLDAEDSAAHLRLRAYSSADGTVTYGCFKRGY